MLIDKDEHWRPDAFKEELWGASVEMRFPIIKLIDYRNQLDVLEQSSNPFAQVILAQLAALEKQLPQAKLMSKVALIKRLYTQGRGKDDIINLLTFIDWVMALPSPLELECQEVIRVIEEELHVRYVTSFERIGFEKGVQKGEGMLLIRQLERKFKTLPEQYKQKIEKASADNLLEWGERVLDSQALEDVFET